MSSNWRAASTLLLASACAVAPAHAQTGGNPGATVSARGVLRAAQEAVMSSAISARVVSMPYREGDLFAKGAALVSFDCGTQQAELQAALAGQAAEARNVQMQTELLRVQATGQVDLDLATEHERERGARAQAIRQSMRGCQLSAPFAGRVVETYARLYESPPANEKLLRIVSDGPLELHAVVPSRWLTWLKPGATFNLKVDETGDVVAAVVQRVSAAVDPVSQTVKIIAAVPKRPALVLPGMSGTVAWNERAEAARVATATPLAAAAQPTQATAATPPPASIPAAKAASAPRR
jgi:membrane fusion protein (multidrug efflux system)